MRKTGALAVLVTASLALVPSFYATQDAPALVQGQVVDSATGRPIANAVVTIVTGFGAALDSQEFSVGRGATSIEIPIVTGNEAPGPRPSRQTLVLETDGSGRFTEAVPSGNYSVRVSANGFGSKEYGQRSGRGVGRFLALAPGNTVSLVFELDRVSTIAGEVRDMASLPLRGMSVVLLRQTFSVEGERLLRLEEEVLTDESGHYVLSDVIAGRYLLAAGPTRGAAIQPRDVPDYVWTYYPGVTDAGLSAPLDVLPGARLTGLDFEVPTALGHSIVGEIVDRRTNAAPPDAAVELVGLPPFVRAGTSGLIRIRGAYNPASGVFQFSDVQDGSYRLEASLPRARPESLVDSLAGALSPNPNASSMVITVSGEDVETAVIRVPGTGNVTGQLLIEGSEDADVPWQAGGLQVAFEATSRLRPSFPRTAVDSDTGRFEIPVPTSGEYRLQVWPLPGNTYMSAARLNGTPVRGNVIDFPPDIAKHVEITLDPNGGEVYGRVTDANGTPISGAAGLLLPDTLPSRLGYYAEFRTDSSGAFTIHGVPPGVYRIFAWDSIDEEEYFDRALLTQSRSRAGFLRIDRATHTTVDIELLSN